MTEDAYYSLREFLNMFPLGFPATGSGVEIKILEKLFTEEEARAAILLTPFPGEATAIAERAGVDPAWLGTLLESMAARGLVFRVRRNGLILYNSAPFMIGLYEYSVGKIDRELAELYSEYYESAYMDEMGASDVPGFKVLPIGESIEDDMVLYPFANLIEEVRAARKISVADCICRREARLIDKGCDHPAETCLSFGAAAEYYIENGIGREVTADEAIAILEEADRAGLVHAGTNTRHLSNLCNCCPCCCASMKGITTRGHERHRYFNALFEAVVDAGACDSCEQCAERCPVGAISVVEGAAAVVERDACLGCGLCAGVCPERAITVHLKENIEEPFERVLALGAAIIEGKRRGREAETGGGHEDG